MNTLSELLEVRLSGDFRVDSLLDDPSPWNFLLPYRNVLYYTFDTSAGSYIAQNTGSPVFAFNAAQREAVRSIMQYAGSLIGVGLVELSSSSSADFHFAATDLDVSVMGLNSIQYSYRYSGDRILSLSAEASIYLDNVQFLSENGTPTAGTQGYTTLLHEVGHALGLGHPFDAPNALPGNLDNTNYTVMSYHNAGAQKSTYQQFDLWALTWIYGNDGLGGQWGYNSIYGNSLTPGGSGGPVTSVLPDTTPPMLLTTNPVDGGSAFPVDGSIVLSFNEVIQRGTGSIVLRTADGTVVERFDAATSVNIVVAGNTLTLRPSANLAFGTTYALDLAAGIVKDTAGNDYAGWLTYDWTTSAPTDTSLPTVVAFAPVDGALDVAPSSNMVLTFSEAIQRGSGSIALMTSAGAVVETYDAAVSANLTIAGSVLVVDPSANLAYATGYTLRFAPGTVRDLAGLGFAGTTSYDFTTLAAPDTMPPTIALSTSDTDLRAGETAKIAFVLSESASDFTAADVTVSGGTLSGFAGSGTQFSATFTPLANSIVTASVRVGSGKFTDAAGNANADGAEVDNVVTMSVNTQAPAVLASHPADDSVGVPIDGNYMFIFSEAIKRGTGTIALTTATGTVVETYDAATSGNIGISGSTLTIDPSANLDIFTRYVVALSPGAVEDLAGNDYLSRDAYNFRTETLDGLYHFFLVAFAAAPGVAYMTQLADAYNYGLSLRDIVDIFTTKPQFTAMYPQTLTNAELAAQLVANVVKHSASAADILDAAHEIQRALDLGWSRGDVIYQVFGNLADKPQDDAHWGGTARQFANETAVARYLTEVMAYDSTNLSALRDVVADVTPYTDVSSPEQIATLIGVALV